MHIRHSCAGQPKQLKPSYRLPSSRTQSIAWLGLAYTAMPNMHVTSILLYTCNTQIRHSCAGKPKQPKPSYRLPSSRVLKNSEA